LAASYRLCRSPPLDDAVAGPPEPPLGWVGAADDELDEAPLVDGPPPLDEPLLPHAALSAARVAATAARQLRWIPRDVLRVDIAIAGPFLNLVDPAMAEAGIAGTR